MFTSPDTPQEFITGHIWLTYYFTNSGIQALLSHLKVVVALHDTSARVTSQF
jgi:hypothetical protein